MQVDSNDLKILSAYNQTLDGAQFLESNIEHKSELKSQGPNEAKSAAKSEAKSEATMV